MSRSARPASVRARAERALALLREEKLIASAMGRGHFVIRGG
jgi:DNA-binding GntR family transcriptional regulator